MSDKPSKYSRAAIRHLRVLSTPNDESLDYPQAYEDFVDLWGQLGSAYKHGQVTERERELIDAVFECIKNVVDNAVGFHLGTDEALMNAPEWEPMREAARAAIKKLEG